MAETLESSRANELRAMALRLLELAEDADASTESVPEGKRRKAPARDVDPQYLRLAAMAIYRVRRRRASYFDADLFGEVAWDMLLDLFIQAIDGKRVSSTSLCLAAEAPVATGLRWINHLVDKGLAERSTSQSDARVTYVTLSKTGMAMMTGFIAGEYATPKTRAPFMLAG